MSYHEPQDPRTDKAPMHQQAALSSSNISNAEIVNSSTNEEVQNIKNGMYGKFIKENDDNTFNVDDGIEWNGNSGEYKRLKIIDNKVHYYLYHDYDDPSMVGWIIAIPRRTLKELRHEELFFSNETQIPFIDYIFKHPDYSNIVDNQTAELVYMSPEKYIVLCAEGFEETFESQSFLTPDIKERFAENMIEGDLFPLPMLNYSKYKNGNDYFTQEGRRRVLAVQHLIDAGKIPENTKIPVVIVRKQ